MLRLHVRIDERSAGFLALGLARGGLLRDGRLTPVAVAMTSGTAVANLHPAVLEAHHSGVPLIVLAADRPHELRGTGASQTTDQAGIFGTAVRYTADVPAPDGRAGEVRDVLSTAHRALVAALGLRDRNPGPVHLNLAYREPLEPAPAGATVETPALAWRPPVVAQTPLGPGADPVLTGNSAHTVVVAGDGAGPDAYLLAETQGWPLFAEPSAGCLVDATGIVAYRELLGIPALADPIDNVIVFGHPTLSRSIARLLARPVSVTVVAPGGGPWPDAARNATAVIDHVGDEWLAGGKVWSPSPFRDRWLAASGAAARVLHEATAGVGFADDLAPLAVARALAGPVGRRELLVGGASNPIRDLDLVSALDADGLGGTVIANRGLAGIDGTISTAAGVALALDGVMLDDAVRPCRVRALVGDLTFLHDVGGLLRGPLEPAVNLQIVVVNDDGGSIFATLEHGALAETSAAAGQRFERVFGTAHGVDIGPICAGYGVAHRRVDTLAELAEALRRPAGAGVEVIEVRVPRAHRHAGSADLRARVVAAASAAIAAL
jgi:2-succinyl-5-enolpyruvyl-6-hydroxy-3-cyclohexene-1-carboxylate synthase